MPNPFKRPELRQQYAAATKAYATSHADIVWVDGTPHRRTAAARRPRRSGMASMAKAKATSSRLPSAAQ